MTSGLIGDLVLLRLLVPSKSNLRPSQLRRDLARFFVTPPGPDRWQTVVDELVTAGLVQASPLRLSESGRKKALEFLGVAELPSGSTWRSLPGKYLVPRALGGQGGTENAPRRADERKLAAQVLKTQYRLPADTGDSLTSVLEAIACRELGHPDLSSLAEVKQRVLERLLGTTEQLGKSDLERQFLRKTLGTRGTAALRDRILQQWVEKGETERPEMTTEETAEAPPEELPELESVNEDTRRTEEVDLAEFARTVLAAARHSLHGSRHGDHQVLIHRVWQQVRTEPSFQGFDADSFKARLQEAHRHGLLKLAPGRTEGVSAEDVRESETRDAEHTYHVLQLEVEHPKHHPAAGDQGPHETSKTEGEPGQESSEASGRRDHHA